MIPERHRADSKAVHSILLAVHFPGADPECGRSCVAQIHWFSIINSCVTVLLLTGFLATILMRVLKNDFIKYTRDDDGARRLQSSFLCSNRLHGRECLSAVFSALRRSVLAPLRECHPSPWQRSGAGCVCASTSANLPRRRVSAAANLIEADQLDGIG